MANKEIKKVKQELRDIQKKPSAEQLEPIQALARRIGAPIPKWYKERGQQEFINEIIRNIHIVLQSEMMLSACSFAKWSCFGAAMAALAACISVVLTLLSK